MRARTTREQSAVESATFSMIDALNRFRDAVITAEQAKLDLALLKKADLKRLGLSADDIRHLPEVWREGSQLPRYQARDVQRYINSRKAGPVKRTHFRKEAV